MNSIKPIYLRTYRSTLWTPWFGPLETPYFVTIESSGSDLVTDTLVLKLCFLEMSEICANQFLFPKTSKIC